MEQVQILRGPTVTDAYGNPVQGPLAPVGTLTGLVEPITPEPTSSPGSRPQVIGYRIFVRSSAPTGVRRTDVMLVRGHRCPVSADTAEWRRRDGTHRGDVITTRKAVG